MPTIHRDDGTIVEVSTDRGWLVASFGGEDVELTRAEELRAWDAIKMAAEDDDGSDALYEARRDGRAA